MPEPVLTWEPEGFRLHRVGDPAELVVRLSNLSSPTIVRCFVHTVTTTINGRRARNADVRVEPDEHGNGTARFAIVPHEEGLGEIRLCMISNIAGLARGRILLQVGSITEHPVERLFDPNQPMVVEAVVEDDQAGQATAQENLNAALGPAGPKEFIMADPAEPVRKSPLVVFAGVVTALAIVFGIAIARMPPTLEVTTAPPEPVATVAPPAAEPVPVSPVPAPTPVVAPEPVEPTPVAVVEPPPPPVPAPAEPVPAKTEPPPKAEPVVAKAEPPPKAEPKPAAPDPKPATPKPAPTAAPSTLVVSSMGARPSCVADCAWGNLAENGFPKTVAGKRTVTCADGATWLVAASTKIESGAHAKCYTASGISAP